MPEEILIKQRRLSFGGAALVGCLSGLLVICGLGAAGVYALFSMLGGGEEVSAAREAYAPIVQLVMVVVACLVAHGLTITWQIRARPGRRALVLTQAPYVAAYAAILPWWYLGHWSALFIAWGAAGLAALGWLTVWFLREPRAAWMIVSVALWPALMPSPVAIPEMVASVRIGASTMP